MKRNLKFSDSLLICLDGFSQGGTQQAILNILPILTRKFTNVNLVILQKSDKDLNIPSARNLTITKFNSNRITDLKLIFVLIMLLRKQKPGLILSSMYRSNVFMALCKPKSTKLFWMEQNTYYTRTQAQWNLLRCLMHRVTKIICISDDVANLTLEKLGKNTKLCVIPNPVMIVNKQFNLLNKKNEFIFIGRLTPQKNPHLALLSFANFLRIYNGKSHLHIVGGGELERELKTKASDLKIKSNCTFYGSISNKEVYNLLEKTKTLISTSRIEGLAMVRLEALANGNCIVTTESGGTHQYFSNNSNLGVFVSASNPFIFSELMLKSLEKKYWNSKTINMRISKSKKFNSENIVKLILLEYKKIKIEK